MRCSSRKKNVASSRNQVEEIKKHIASLQNPPFKMSQENMNVAKSIKEKLWNKIRKFDVNWEGIKKYKQNPREQASIFVDEGDEMKKLVDSSVAKRNQARRIKRIKIKITS